MANSGVGGPTIPDGNGTTTESRAAMKAVSASKAAEIIVRGIERDAYHVFVGKDATLMDKLYRVSPVFAARTIANQMRALLPA